MSRLDDLVKEKCPNGVKFVELQEVAKIVRGERVTKKDLISDGVYPVVSGGTSPLGRLNQKNRDKDTITVASYGTAGYVNWQEEDFWANDVCLCIYPKSELSNRFLYFYLKSQQQYLYSKTTKAIPDHIPTEVIKELRTPVPPLEVQNEIVQILDNFAELTAELTAELSNRKKQYEYYRDLLLNFDENEQRERVEWFTLADVCMKISSGGTPNRSRSDYYGGSIPWVRTQEVDFCDIEDVEMSITDEGLKNSSAKWIPENCVIVAMYGATAGKSAINKIPVTTNQACCNLQVNEEIAMYKYVYYWVCREYENLKALGQGSQNNINAGVIKSYKIPIPSLEHQKYIVDMLDRFNVLTNDISEGLPAEIEARKKQYAYYRDKLLSFKEQKVGAINA